MWKFVKIMASVLTGCIFMLSMFGCGDSSAEKPDYSASTAVMERYGFCGPTNGRYTDVNGFHHFDGVDFRTVERFQEYKDCGFDVLLIQGNDPYNGEPFETSWLKKNLDMAEQVGLKVIAFDLRIHDLSAYWKKSYKTSLIGDGGLFETFEDLVAEIDEYTKDYRNHPAFYGMTVLDEPLYEDLGPLGEVYRALKTLKPDMAINVCLLPFMDDTAYIPYYAGKQTKLTSPRKAYDVYMQRCIETTGEKFLLYDNYPFRYNATSNKNYVLASYLRNLQAMALKSQEIGGDFGIVMQSFATTGHREVSEADLRWQASVTMSFGAIKHCWFTYWMFPNQNSEPAFQAVIDNDGTKMLYDELQRVQREVDGYYKVISNFKYKQTLTFVPEDDFNVPQYFAELIETDKLTGIASVETDGRLLINEMYDASKGYDGFFVINADDPIAKTVNKTTLTFEKAKNVMIINRGQTTYQKLDKKTLNLIIEPGDSYFVIPY